MRQTNVVAATGMLVGRFTWTEVTRYPETTKRRLAALARRAEQRGRSERVRAIGTTRTGNGRAASYASSPVTRATSW